MIYKGNSLIAKVFNQFNMPGLPKESEEKAVCSRPWEDTDSNSE